VYFEGSQRVWEAARDRGVIFRAVGQEPGWVLEIEDSRMTLVTNYGADEVVTPVPEPVVDAASQTTTWHAVTEANDLHIESREQPCVDTMSEERFSMTVTVILNGTTYDGCGRMLDRLP
jgi:putative lipoprotein